MIKREQLGIFYRGFIPMINSQIFVYLGVEWSRKFIFEYKYEAMEYWWPLLYLTGCVFAWP